MKGILVNLKLNLMLEVLIWSLKESTSFPMILQNLILGIPASLLMSGTRKRSIGSYSEKLV